MATVTRYVDTDVSAGTGSGNSWANAYSSMSSWESTEETDLIGDGDTHVLNIRASSGTAETAAAVTISNWITDATHFIQIIGADVLDSEWNTSAYRLVLSTSLTAFTILEDYTEVYNLQFENSAGTSRRVCDVNADEVLIDKCIFRADNTYSSTVGLRFIGASTTCYMRNTLMYGYGTNGMQDGLLIDNGKAFVHNCTIENVKRNAYAISSDGEGDYKNNVAYNAGTLDYQVTSGGTITAVYCAHVDGDPGTNGIDISADAGTDLFEDYANNVYKVKDTGSSIYNVGTDISADGNLAVTEDMGGDSRSQWDVGCDEFVGAAGGRPLPARALSGPFSGPLGGVI